MCVCNHVVDCTLRSRTDSDGCLPARCRLSRCDGCAGTVGGSTSIIVAFEPNANLPRKVSALAMARDSRESRCFVVLVGVVLGGLNGVASGGMGGEAIGLVRVGGAIDCGGGLAGRWMMGGGV